MTNKQHEKQLYDYAVELEKSVALQLEMQKWDSEFFEDGLLTIGTTNGSI